MVIISRQDERRPADAIVVLGAAQYNGRPSPVLKARLDHALELYRAGLAPRLIATGGTGTGDRVSEAAAGQRYLAQSGIPRDSIVTVSTGRNTAETMDAVSRYLHLIGRTRVLLVSDPFHMARLRVEAWRVHLSGWTSPTRTSPISRDRRTELGYLLAEAVKLPVTFLRGLLP